MGCIRIANAPQDTIDENGYLCDCDENGNPKNGVYYFDIKKRKEVYYYVN